MIQGLGNLPYKVRFNQLNLHSLERRARGDMTEVYKWVKELIKETLIR